MKRVLNGNICGLDNPIRNGRGLPEKDIPEIYAGYPRPIFCRTKQFRDNVNPRERLIKKYYSIEDDKYIGQVFYEEKSKAVIHMSAVKFNEYGNPVSETIWSFADGSIRMLTNPACVKDPTATGVCYAYTNYDFQTTDRYYSGVHGYGYCKYNVKGTSKYAYELFAPAMPPIPNGLISPGEANRIAVEKSKEEERRRRIASAKYHKDKIDADYQYRISKGLYIGRYNVDDVPYEKQLIATVYNNGRSIGMLPRDEAYEEFKSGLSRRVCQEDMYDPIFIQTIATWHYTRPYTEAEYEPGFDYDAAFK